MTFTITYEFVVRSVLSCALFLVGVAYGHWLAGRK